MSNGPPPARLLNLLVAIRDLPISRSNQRYNHICSPPGASFVTFFGEDGDAVWTAVILGLVLLVETGRGRCCC